MVVKIKKLREDARMPYRGSAAAAGYDLYACMDAPVSIEPYSTAKIGTGISAEIPEGYFGAVVARSGLAAKQGLRPANCIGICDSDYRGEYIIFLHNDSGETRVVQPGDRIAQLIIMPFLPVDFEQVDELGETERGAGGFGSTGR